MATNNKRREATRRQLEQQLEQRQQREARRKQLVLVSSIIGTLVVIAVVVVAVILINGGSTATPKKTNDAAGGTTSSASPSTSAAASSSTASTPCTPVSKAGGAVVFDDVSVGNATNLKVEPKVRSCSTATPSGLEYKDLVVGKGKAATPASSVNVQYTGVLYKNGTEFDSSWARGQAATFSLTGVVPGFTQGIGGSGSKIAPMRVGGRRIIILPPGLGYGSTASSSIPANSSLVFVVDLLSVK